jgi:hypothetical protein
MEYPLNYNPALLSESQLWKKAMYLEQKLQEYLVSDKYIGKNSRVAKITFECNVLWRALEKLGHSQRAEANRASLTVL